MFNKHTVIRIILGAGPVKILCILRNHTSDKQDHHIGIFNKFRIFAKGRPQHCGGIRTLPIGFAVADIYCATQGFLQFIQRTVNIVRRHIDFRTSLPADQRILCILADDGDLLIFARDDWKCMLFILQKHNTGSRDLLCDLMLTASVIVQRFLLALAVHHKSQHPFHRCVNVFHGQFVLFQGLLQLFHDLRILRHLEVKSRSNSFPNIMYCTPV